MSDLARRLLPDIRAILSGSDLSTVSAKAVRKELVRRGADEAAVKDARKDIDARITEIYDQLTTTAPPPSSRSDAAPAYTPGSNHAGPSSAYAVPASSQPEPLADTKPVKRERDHVKQERDRRPEPDRDPPAESDAQMAARLQAEYDSLGSGRASRGTAQAQAKPKKKRKIPVQKRKSRAEVESGEEGDGGEVKKKRKGGGGGAFNKDLILSDALAALVGEPRLSRPQTVKRIWEYVKERGLQDQDDKRFILCDDKLRSVFHTDKVHMFTMNKILASHFMNPDEIIEGGGDAAEAKPKPVVAPLKVEPGRFAGPMPSSYTVASSNGAEDHEEDDSEEGDDDDYY